MVKELILDCKKVLDNNPFIWFAFQTNALNDHCSTSKTFKEEFEIMIKYLEEEADFFFPELFMNMRNSREVTEVAKTVKTYDRFFGAKITNLVDSLNVWKSSICSFIPMLIPISEDNLNMNYSKLFEHATEKGKLNVILFREKVSQGNFDVNKIEKAIRDCGVEQENIFVHTFRSNHTKEDIKDFLRNQKGFLICQEELFCGMEAKSVVYCLEEDYGYDNNIRTNLMRACSQLNIIYSFEKDRTTSIALPKANLDPTFINGCEQVMRRVTFKCVTCEEIAKELGKYEHEKDDILICKSCSLSCHHYHQIEEKYVDSDDEDLSVDENGMLIRTMNVDGVSWKNGRVGHHNGWSSLMEVKVDEIEDDKICDCSECVKNCECRTKHSICLFKKMKLIL